MNASCTKKEIICWLATVPRPRWGRKKRAWSSPLYHTRKNFLFGGIWGSGMVFGLTLMKDLYLVFLFALIEAICLILDSNKHRSKKVSEQFLV
jgi:hypothetical protein